MESLLLRTILLGVILLASGCKHLATEGLTSRQLSRKVDEPSQPELVEKKTKGRVDHQVSYPPKLTDPDKPSRSGYIGLTIQEARALAQQQGREFRIGHEDGETYPITANAIPGRITAAVKDGVVFSINVEGGK